MKQSAQLGSTFRVQTEYCTLLIDRLCLFSLLVQKEMFPLTQKKEVFFLYGIYNDTSRHKKD